MCAPSGAWKACSGAIALGRAVLAEDVQRLREALQHRALDLAVAGEHDEPLAGAAEVVDPAQRRRELAARRQQLQRVQAHEPFGAERSRDLRVELAQVERLAAQPRHEIALGEAVLGLVVELDRHDRARLRRQLRQHVALEPAREAACAQVPVQALVGVRPLEARAELGAGAEVLQPPEDPQLRDELGRAVHDRRAREREHERLARHRRGQPLHRLRALRARVLAQVRLVDHDGARSLRRAARAGAQPRIS